jgi:hypothetical protein
MMPTGGRVLAADRIAVLVLAACGDDDEPAGVAADGDDRSADCDALAWATPPDPEDREFDVDRVDTVLRPRFDVLETHGPAGIAEDVGTIAAALDGSDEAAGQGVHRPIATRGGFRCPLR